MLRTGDARQDAVLLARGALCLTALELVEVVATTGGLGGGSGDPRLRSASRGWSTPPSPLRPVEGRRFPP